MAKTLFERDQVIKDSTNLFWRHGFNAASMQQVFKATGLKPGSIYLAFGNKEGLFRESLEYYANQSLSAIDTRFEPTESILESLCQMLREMVTVAVASDYYSCFLVKSQLELAFENQELHLLASEQLGKIEARYKYYLEREFKPNIAKSRATSLMLHIFGIRVYGYQNAPEETLLAGLQEGLAWLPWEV